MSGAPGQFHKFDSRQVAIHLTVSSPDGWTKWNICSACLPAGPIQGLYFATLCDYASGLGFRRAPDARYEDLIGVEDLDAFESSLFRKRLTPRDNLYFVIHRAEARSSPDFIISLLLPAKVNWFHSRRIQRSLAMARKDLPSGWLQPFVSAEEKDRVFGPNPRFQELGQISRSLQSYLYSGGAGVLPDSLDAVTGLKQVDKSCYEWLESGPTAKIWGDRPVLKLRAPIEGIYFGCTAANAIIPIGREASRASPVAL